jgi:Tfp pilus assembly protein PilV
VDSRSGSADGFTVVEVVVAITILLVALLSAALLIENGIAVSGNTRNRVVAANLATAAMENVRGLAADPAKFTTIPQGTTYYQGADQNVNGIQFKVTQEVEFVGRDSTTSSCDSPGTPASEQIMQVSQTVTWPNMGGTQPVRQVTTLAPPVGAYSASSGSLAVKVYNAASKPDGGVSVQITGPETKTLATTSEGCAYFDFITPGTYTATIVSGGVSDQELASPVQTASVVIGQTTPLQFQYDAPATIDATFPSPSNTAGAPPYATGMSISVGNTGLQPYRQFSFPATTTGDTTSSPDLYPYASGYTVFAGNCTDNNPNGIDTNGNAFYPTAGDAPVSVAANTTTPVTVPLYTLAIHVQNAAATPVDSVVPTAGETAAFGAPYTAVCTNGTATAAPPTLGLATTSATGDSTTALPLGHWTITAKCTAGAPACPTADAGGSVNVWVRPDGVYDVDGSGAYTTMYPGPITVTVS